MNYKCKLPISLSAITRLEPSEARVNKLDAVANAASIIVLEKDMYYIFSFSDTSGVVSFRDACVWRICTDQGLKCLSYLSPVNTLRRNCRIIRGKIFLNFRFAFCGTDRLISVEA